MLTPERGTSRKRKASANSHVKRPPNAWYHFLAAEKERVKQAGFHGRVAILKECARRWAIHKRVGTSSAPLMLGMSDAGRTTNRGPLWGERSSERLTTIKKDFKKKHLNGPQRRGMQTFSVKQPLFDRCDTRVAGAQIWARLHPLQLAPPTDSPTCTFPSSSIKTRLTHLSFSFCNLHHQTFRFFSPALSLDSLS